MSIWIPPEQYYASLPKKAMAAGVLLLNEAGEILLVKTSYRSHWEFPGGVVDKDESPQAAAIRETREEIGIAVSDLRLLCVQHVRQTDPRPETIQFLFHGGKLTTGEIDRIVLQDAEIESMRFVPEDAASALLNNTLRDRLHAGLAAYRLGTTAYIES